MCVISMLRLIYDDLSIFQFSIGITTDFMFEPSSTLIRPTHTLQSMWRYLSAERLNDLLATEELFFTHLPAFEDAREGALTFRSREHLANWYQRQDNSTRSKAYAQVDEYQSLQRYYYVNCWHMNDHESYLMWKAYAQRGFAIETSFERIQASLSNSPALVTGGVVDYVNFERDFTPVGNTFNHVATKDLPYRDEREFRLVFWDVDPRNADYAKVENGVRVKVDIKMLIRKIIKSPYQEPLAPELERLMEANGLSLGSSAVATRTPR